MYCRVYQCRHVPACLTLQCAHLPSILSSKFTTARIWSTRVSSSFPHTLSDHPIFQPGGSQSASPASKHLYKNLPGAKEALPDLHICCSCRLSSASSHSPSTSPTRVPCCVLDTICSRWLTHSCSLSLGFGPAVTDFHSWLSSQAPALVRIEPHISTYLQCSNNAKGGL